jgi:hypothetical protein
MVVWISLDLDYLTGDCRIPGKPQAQCAWQCGGCVGRGRGRGEGGQERDDALAEFERIRQWLMTLDIAGPVVVRDCHADIVEWLRPGDVVLDWDEHCDAENYTGQLDCGNWITLAQANGAVVKERRGMPLPEITSPVHLFIAVSTPYTSTVCDQALLDMLAEIGQVDFDLGVKR